MKPKALFWVVMLERFVGQLASFPLHLKSAFPCDRPALGVCTCVSSPAHTSGPWGNGLGCCVLGMVLSPMPWFLLKKKAFWDTASLRSTEASFLNFICRKYYHGIVSVCSQWLCSRYYECGGLGIRKGQDSLMSQYQFEGMLNFHQK